MVEIEFSIMTRGATSHTHLSQLLEQFETQHRARIRPHYLAWEHGWAENSKIALQGCGPDVSEVGSTWVGSLAAMNVLRPFAAKELTSLDSPSPFLPAAWRAETTNGGQPTWAIPWLADTRVLYYRRDLLQQAGIDESEAFRDHRQLERTLLRLQESGVPTPWVMPTQHALSALHQLASWVWGVGGHFFSPDGQRLLFNEPKTLEAICHYFSFHRFLSPAARGLEGEQADALYQTGQAAVCITGPWLYHSLDPELQANTGITPAPGVPFVGGSNLAIWRHTKYEREALKLIKFLTRSSTQTMLNQLVGLLPIRIDELEWKDFMQHPLCQAVTESFKNGRSFSTLPSWGLVEDRLSIELDHTWATLLANPDLDLAATITRHFESLAHRLNLTLASRGR